MTLLAPMLPNYAEVTGELARTRRALRRARAWELILGLVAAVAVIFAAVFFILIGQLEGRIRRLEGDGNRGIRGPVTAKRGEDGSRGKPGQVVKTKAPPLSSSASSAPSVAGPPAVRIEKLIAAIGSVESNHDDSAVGDSGRSRGRYQISRAYWIDGGGLSRRYGRDVTDAARCRLVMIGYWKRYARVALTAGNLETLARIHNGGPRGDRKAATVPYWRKVRAAMTAQHPTANAQQPTANRKTRRRQT